MKDANGDNKPELIDIDLKYVYEKDGVFYYDDQETGQLFELEPFYNDPETGQLFELRNDKDLEAKIMTQTNEERKAKIFYSKFDNDKINAGGWECIEGQLLLKLTSPLEGKSINAINEALNKNKFRYVGEIDVKNENDAWSKIQNVNEGHELNDRSMMIGDVILFESEGFVVESCGFSKLSEEQLNKFKNLEAKLK